MYSNHILLIILLAFAHAANFDIANELNEEKDAQNCTKLLLDSIGCQHEKTPSVLHGAFKQLPQPNPNQQLVTTTREPSPIDLDGLLDLEEEIARRQIHIPMNQPTVGLRPGIRPPPGDPYANLFRPGVLQQPPPGPSNRPPIDLPPLRLTGPVLPGNQPSVLEPPPHNLGPWNQPSVRHPGPHVNQPIPPPIPIAITPPTVETHPGIRGPPAEGGGQRIASPNPQIAAAIAELNKNLKEQKDKKKIKQQERNKKDKRTNKEKNKSRKKGTFGIEGVQRLPLSWADQERLAQRYERENDRFADFARRFRAGEYRRGRGHHIEMTDDIVEGLRALYRYGHLSPFFIRKLYGVNEDALIAEFRSRNIPIYEANARSSMPGAYELAEQHMQGHLERRAQPGWEPGGRGSPMPANQPALPPLEEEFDGTKPSTSSAGIKRPFVPSQAPPPNEGEAGTSSSASQQPSQSGSGRRHSPRSSATDLPGPPNVTPPKKRGRSRSRSRSGSGSPSAKKAKRGRSPAKG